MTANKPMTGEQLDELMTIAVNMQRDSEKVSERPAAMFAYAVQVAVLELRKVRNEAAALAAENAQMLRLLTDISENHDEYVNQDEYLYAGIPMDYVSEINSYVSRDVEAENPFKATDAFMAEVRAQGVEMLRDSIAELGGSIEDTIDLHHYCSDFAAQIRKGVQS
ncbi:hypothetical protein D8W77_01275 [Enterobacter hormaechei]|nr:hypothetical protein [Enterobacter hormaechei]EGQ5313061.1 hypothetical protein [Enterobacter hormaechei]EGQ5323268.1 hypothetical protein [Enterobacter hormaechei]EKT5039860.1 hypothetical protein [Enterobacter hormaechei]EKV8268512.1 hypothetical protein [Enterobacter hormaechei]